MTRPERQREVNGPRTGSFTPAHASSAAPPSTEVKQEAIAAAPPAPAYSPPGLTRKHGMAAAPSSLPLKKKCLPSAAAAPPFMPMRATAKKVEVRKEKNSTAPVPAETSSRTAAPAVEKCIHCTVGNENSCRPCLRTTYTCAETAAGISNGQKKPETGRTFLGVAVDGSNEEDEEGDHFSIGSNVRRSSGCRSSPSEKSSSPQEVTSIDKNLNELLENMQNKWDARQKRLQDKYKELDRMVQQVQQMARECGADESTPDLWLGVLEIIHSERATKFFMGSDPVGRMTMIKQYASVHDYQDLVGGSQPLDIQSNLKRDAEPAEVSEEEWEKEFFNLFQYYNNAGTSSREKVLPGGRRLSKPSQLPCSSQGKQVSSSRLPKRNKTKR